MFVLPSPEAEYPSALVSNRVNVTVHGDFYSPPQISSGDRSWLEAMVVREQLAEDRWLQRQMLWMNETLFTSTFAPSKANVTSKGSSSQPLLASDIQSRDGVVPSAGSAGTTASGDAGVAMERQPPRGFESVAGARSISTPHHTDPTATLDGAEFAATPAAPAAGDTAGGVAANATLTQVVPLAAEGFNEQTTPPRDPRLRGPGAASLLVHIASRAAADASVRKLA